MTRSASMRWSTFACAALLAGCGGSSQPAVEPPPPRPVAATTPVTSAPPEAKPLEALTPPPPTYEAKGRRDPFAPLEVAQGAKASSVSSAKLTGIVRGPQSRWALVETGDGIGYILKPGDALGDGRVVEIGRNSVVFAVSPKAGMAADRIVLTMVTD